MCMPLYSDRRWRYHYCNIQGKNLPAVQSGIKTWPGFTQSVDYIRLIVLRDMLDIKIFLYL